MKGLWLRIFIYTVVLLSIFQLGGLLMHRYSVNVDETRRFAALNITSMAEGLEGHNLGAARAVANIFNRRHQRVWIVRDGEDGEKKVLVGKPIPSLVERIDREEIWQEGDIRIRSVDDPYIKLLAHTRVQLDDGEAQLYMGFGEPRRPDMWNVFFQGMIGFSIVGMILAFWMARSVSRPLRRMRNEVLEIASGGLDGRVNPEGPAEVRDVALAVNDMADNLSKYLRNMRQLVANISHELRSPLARMQVSLALLESRVEAAGDQKSLDRIRLLQEEMEHMNKLIGDTLLTSKLDLEGQRELGGQVALSELTREMLRRQEPLLDKKTLSLTADIADGIVLPGDETLLCNMVSNFLDNAVKYSPEGGQIRVKLSEQEGEALLEVENTHEPLAPEVLEQLFEPFYRGGIATGGGVGLGLSLVRQIAALHGGRVSASNTADGVKFWVRLPLGG